MKRHMKLKLFSLLVVVMVLMISTYKVYENQNHKNFKLLCEQWIQTPSTVDERQFEWIQKYYTKQNKYSELYTLIGIHEYTSGNLDRSMKMFDLSIENINKQTDHMASFYANKYLFELNKLNGNLDEAKHHFIAALNAIPPKAINDHFKEIGALIASPYDIDELRTLAIYETNQIFLTHSNLNLETELYLRERIRTLYILSDRYAEATESLIESINIAGALNNPLSKADAMISLAVVLSELGGAESAANLIKNALSVPLENELDNAYIQAFGSLNLAYIQFFYLHQGEEALKSLSTIEQYRPYFSEEDYRDIEIFKLIYTTNVLLLTQDLTHIEQNLMLIDDLLKVDQNELFLNKELDFYLTIARYLYATDHFNQAFEIYQYVLNECKNLDNEMFMKITLEEMISVCKTIGNVKWINYYSNELSNLKSKEEQHRYYDYSVFIANSIEKQKLIETNYKEYIKLLKIIFLSILLMILVAQRLYHKYKKLKYLSEYDGLTLIYNRKKFDTDIKKLLERKTNFSCLTLDVDFFKRINDTYGHAVGDIVLNKCAQKIKNMLSGDETIYRYGGEEFIILIKHKNQQDVLLLSEKIRAAVEKMKWHEDMTITISIGVAFSERDRDQILKVSDENLYKAKKKGTQSGCFLSDPLFIAPATSSYQLLLTCSYIPILYTILFCISPNRFEP